MQSPLYSALQQVGLSPISGVPDSEFRDLIRDLEENPQELGYMMAPREDIAVGLACGAYLAGNVPLVFMESSGIGTALDALTSLAIVYGIPLVLLVAWAGYRDRDVPHHNAIGGPLEDIVKALRIPYGQILSGSSMEDLRATFEEAKRTAQSEGKPYALLLIPKDLK